MVDHEQIETEMRTRRAIAKRLDKEDRREWVLRETKHRAKIAAWVMVVDLFPLIYTAISSFKHPDGGGLNLYIAVWTWLAMILVPGSAVVLLGLLVQYVFVAGREPDQRPDRTKPASGRRSPHPMDD